MSRRLAKAVKQDQLAARRLDVARLRVQGISQADIAARLGVDQGQISRDLAAIREERKARYAEEDQGWKELQVERLEWLFAEAVAAWERSKLPRKRARLIETALPKPAQGTSPKRQEVETQTDGPTGREGNPKFLDACIKAIREIKSIKGDEAPAPNIVIINNQSIDLSLLTTQDLETVLAAQDRIRALLALGEGKRASAEG